MTRAAEIGTGMMIKGFGNVTIPVQLIMVTFFMEEAIFEVNPLS